jgi:DNA-directed RNA polymerase sigma subunit (sigma70/sigma32)
MRRNPIAYSIYDAAPIMLITAASVRAYEAACRQRCAIHASDVPSTQLLTDEMRCSINYALRLLGPKENDMLQRHCGLSGAPESYNDIAKTHSVSKQRVYERIQGALKKIRRKLKKA